MNEFLNWLRHDTVGLLLLAGVGIALLREVVAGRGMVPLPENTRSTGTHALINPGYYNPQARTAQLGDDDRVGPTPHDTHTTADEGLRTAKAGPDGHDTSGIYTRFVLLTRGAAPGTSA